MAARGGTQSGSFHLKSSVELSTDRVTAYTTEFAFGIAFSRNPIPKGQKFSVIVLKPGVVPVARSRHYVPPQPCLCIGVTTKGPLDTGPELQSMDDVEKSDQHWYATIDKYRSKAKGKGHQGPLPWDLDSSQGQTAGCWVSESGEFRLCCWESDVGDVMSKGLPTDKPLWGFVVFYGEWMVEANYKVAIPKGRPQLAAPADCPKGSSPVQLKPKTPAGHPQDYAGKTFHFVERPPEWLVCAVCQALAHDPVQAKCCGKIYCSRCIATWKTKSDSCPTCRSTEQSEPPFNVSEDKNARQQIISLFVYCPKWKEGCDKKMELSEVKSHFTSNNCFLFQCVECEYKRFGCAIVLPRKDMAEHLKTSVEVHIQMTKKRVEEMEEHLQEEKAERQVVEMQLRDVKEQAQWERQRLKEAIARKVEQMEERAKKQETRLKDAEERAEKERKIMNEVIVHRTELMKDRAEEREARLQEGTERKLMKEKMHRTNTLMRWLLIYVPVLLLVTTFIGYHQGLLPPITAVILSYLLGLFGLIHYRVL